MNQWLNAWYFLYIAAAILSVVLIYMPQEDAGRGTVFLAWLTGLLSLVAFILYIIWLTQFNDKNVLQTLWIVTLIATVVLSAAWIFFTDINLQASALQLSGYTFIIFIGAIIAYFTKK